MNAVFFRDLRLAFGAGGGFGQSTGFFIIVIFLFVISIGANAELLQKAGSAIVYIAALLSGLLSMDRYFKRDYDDGSLTQLSLSNVPMSYIVLTKAAVHWLTTGFTITLLTPISAVLLGLNASQTCWLMISLLVGTPALSLLGAIVAALTLTIARANLIQAIISLPLFVPSLIYGTMAAVEGEKQIAALSFLGGLTLLSITFAPWVSAKIIDLHQN